MARIIYSATRKQFFTDWSQQQLVNKMVEGAIINHIGYSTSELNSWHANVDTWATEPEGINQIGCIFSIQGLELDYMGVIISPDLDYNPSTGTLVAAPGKNMDVKTGDADIYDRHIKSIYRVLLTRGVKGCYVYCCNSGVADYISKCLNSKK